VNLNRSPGDFGSGLSKSQEQRLTVLDLVRRMNVGEDVSTEDLLAMSAWVLDGDPGVARQVADDIHRRYHEHHDGGDAVRYRPRKPPPPVEPGPDR
jgi:hypothetical protein